MLRNVAYHFWFCFAFCYIHFEQSPWGIVLFFQPISHCYYTEEVVCCRNSDMLFALDLLKDVTSCLFYLPLPSLFIPSAVADKSS